MAKIYSFLGVRSVYSQNCFYVMLKACKGFYRQIGHIQTSTAVWYVARQKCLWHHTFSCSPRCKGAVWRGGCLTSGYPVVKNPPAKTSGAVHAEAACTA